MMSTNLYSSLVFALAAAATAGVAGCAVGEDDASAPEPSLQSASLPCQEASYQRPAETESSPSLCTSLKGALAAAESAAVTDHAVGKGKVEGKGKGESEGEGEDEGEHERERKGEANVHVHVHAHAPELSQQVTFLPGKEESCPCAAENQNAGTSCGKSGSCHCCSSCNCAGNGCSNGGNGCSNRCNGAPQTGAGAPQGSYGPSQGSYGAPQTGAGAPQGGCDPSQGGYDPSQGGYDPSQVGWDPSQGGYDPSQVGCDPSQGVGYGAPQGGMYEGSPAAMQVGGVAGGCINGNYAPMLGLSFGLAYCYPFSSLLLSPFYWGSLC